MKYIEHLENFPALGSVFMLHEHRIEVLELDDNRVSNVRITPANKKDPGADAIEEMTQSADYGTDTRNANTSENLNDKDTLANPVIDSVSQSGADKPIMPLDQRSDTSAETMAAVTHDDYPAQGRNGSSQSRRVGNQRG